MFFFIQTLLFLMLPLTQHIHVLFLVLPDQNVNDVITYTAVGQPDTLQLFEILPTGGILVKSELLGLPKDTYRVNQDLHDNILNVLAYKPNYNNISRHDLSLVREIHLQISSLSVY